MLKTVVNSLFAITACLYLSGSQLAFLQVVAWSGMLVSYSAENGVTDGLRDTFSGQKPCSMCKAISAARIQEETGEGKQPVLPRGMDKIWTEMLPAGEWFRVKRVPLAHLEVGHAPPCLPIDSDGSRPPVPPPRCLA